MRSILLAVVLLSALAFAGNAQTRPAAGSVVQIRTAQWPKGRVFTIVNSGAADTLFLRIGRGLQRPRRAGDSVAVPRDAITRLDLSTPRTRREGMRIGGLSGALIGAMTGLTLGLLTSALGAEYYPNGTDRPPVPSALFDVPVGALVGGVVGAVGGAWFPGTRWRRVDPPAW